MKQTKVCIIAKYHFPLDTRLNQQVKALIESGIPCDIICGSDGIQLPIEKLNIATIHRVFKKPKSQVSFLMYLISTFNFFTTAFLKLLQLSFKHDYKVIIVHTLPEFLVFVTFINKILGSRIILDGRDLTVDLLSSRWRGRNLFLLRTIAMWVENCFVFFCDEIITASNGFKRSLIARHKSLQKVTVLVNTADENIFHYMNDKNIPQIKNNARFIYHGTVSDRFGVFNAVKAMKIINEHIPNSTLTIFGFYDPAYRKKIEKYIADEKISKNIHLYEVLPLEKIYSQILNMDLGIVPYLSDSFMNIALSTKMFEYIASGLPVVASRLKSGEELFNDSCVHYSQPGNAEDLAIKIIELCSNPELRAKKREQAYKVFYQNFTSESQSKLYLNLIAPHLGIEDLVFVNENR